MRVLRIYHAGRDSTHRARDRALVAAGVELTLVVPTNWPEADDVHSEPFELVALPMLRPGDVNRHRIADVAALKAVVRRVRPDVVDLHEEPFSAVAHQVLGVLEPGQPVVGYTAQNIDKRYPPPFAQRERRALTRLAGLYPCTAQAASVARGKGFAGAVSVLPLGVDTDLFTPGDRVDVLPTHRLTLAIVGRLVPEKGVIDAVQVLAALRADGHDAHLLIVGDGPGRAAIRDRAAALSVTEWIEFLGLLPAPAVADVYRRADVVLVPSRTTRTWVEQFGRVAVEARSCGAVVAGYATGSLPEVLGPDTLLVAEGDAAALAAAIAGRAAGVSAPPPVASWADVAAGQLELYRRALATEPAKPVGRAAAIAEFGPPAAVPGGGRPFALPVLRADTVASRGLAKLIDAVAS